MDRVSEDLEACLSDCQCHFNWALEKYEDSYSDPVSQVEDYIVRHNVLEPGKVLKRFRTSMFLSYIMYRGGLDGWDKLLENGFRVMENSRDPNHPQGRKTLPSYSSPLYSGSTDEFFTDDEVSTTISLPNKDDDPDSVPDEGDDDEDDEYSFNGLYVAGEHIFYSLKAAILFRIGSPSSEVRELLSHAVHMDDMTPGDRAALLFIKATTIRNCGDKGLESAEDILKTSILTDPDSSRWPLTLIVYLGEKRRTKWGQAVDKSEILSVVQVIDSVLQHDLKPWMRARYQFDKLQALNELRTSRKHDMSGQEHARLYLTCNELCETLARTTDKPNILAYCARFLSTNLRGIPEAVRLIEKALEKKPDDTYVNAKACNIYKKTGKLDKALECAEKAARRAYGSWWQVFELKIALEHDLDYEEFFNNLIKNHPQDEHVKVTLRSAALFDVFQGDFRHALSHFKTLLDMCDSDDYICGEIYGGFNPKRVHTVEAAYNVALYVLSSDYEHDDSEGIVGLCNGIREAIEEKFDLNGFKYAGIVTPKQYVEWLRQKPVIGSRDNGPCTASFGSRIPFHGGQRAGGERSNDYQDRGSTYQHRGSTYQDRYCMNRFGDNRAADDWNGFGNRSDSCGAAFRDHDRPSRQRRDPSSELSGMTASSPGNMANYFARLGRSDSVDGATARTTRPQSAGVYSGGNQRSYRPTLFENWRSRSDSDGGTRQNQPQSSYAYKKSADLSGNWRDRDNCDAP